MATTYRTARHTQNSSQLRFRLLHHVVFYPNQCIEEPEACSCKSTNGRDESIGDGNNFRAEQVEQKSM